MSNKNDMPADLKASSDSLELRPLRASDAQVFLEALSRWESDSKQPFAPFFEDGMRIEDYVSFLEKRSSGQKVPAGHVASDTFFGFYKKRLVGRLDLRHRLTPSLLRESGHIGYSVLPPCRNRGIGKSMLGLALPYAKALGLPRVLLTCDDANIASRKIIEACGGVLENIEDFNGKLKRRYWIEL